MDQKSYEALEGQALVEMTTRLISLCPNAILCPLCQIPVSNIRSIISINEFKTNSIGFLCFTCESHFIITKMGKLLFRYLEPKEQTEEIERQ